MDPQTPTQPLEQQPLTQGVQHEQPAPVFITPSGADLPPVTKSASKWRYLILVLLVILVISVVGVGSYLINSENTTPPNPNQALLTPTPELARRTPSPTGALRATPKTFTSATIPFSFTYPGNYTVTQNNTVIDLENAKGTVLVQMSVSLTPKTFIKRTAYMSCDQAFSPKYSGKVSYCVADPEDKATTINGLVVNHFVYNEIGSGGGAYDIIQTTQAPLMEIKTLFAEDEKDSGPKIYAGILPTIRFSDPTPSYAPYSPVPTVSDY